MLKKYVLKALTLAVAAAVLTACGTTADQQAEFRSLSVSFEISPRWAQRGETVTVKLLGDNAKGVQVTVGGVPAAVTILTGNVFTFDVPQAAPAGSQPVEIAVSNRILHSSLHVLGDDVIDGEFVMVLEPGTSEAEVGEILQGIDYTLLEGPQSLGAETGVCSGEMIRFGVNNLTVGATLELLHERSADARVWHSDPLTGYSSGSIDHLTAVGATGSRLRNMVGEGTLIAVLDTGVSQHAELGGRLYTADGYDFVNPGTLPDDSFGEAGHGTAIAVLAAGTLSGVAPQAGVLPVRVCDENGVCNTHDIVQGICYAIATADARPEGADDLVVNLSLGGETPVESVRAAIQYGLDKGVLFAASAGNSRQAGSPAEYPAAFDLDGMVAVGALEQSNELGWALDAWQPASFTTRGNYVDIAAPGVNLTSGDSSGLYRSDFTGTSYATGLVAGALAVWRDANPTLSPADVEVGLEAAARELPYDSRDVGAGMLDLSTVP